MKTAVKILIAKAPQGALEDAAGLAALFLLLFAVLSLPGFA